MTDLVPFVSPPPPAAGGHGWLARLEQGLSGLRKVWPRAEPAPADDDRRALGADLPAADADRVRRLLRDCLEETGGEVAVRDRAIWLGQSYLQLSAAGRLRFLTILATEFDVDPAAVDAAAAAWAAAGDEPVARRQALAALRKATAAPRQELLQNLNALQSGVALLVQMRAEVLSLVREHYALRSLDEDLLALLTGWFDIGNLDMRRLTWDATPPALLDKLIAYEAVHRIDGYDDLRNRLDDTDRRVFAFFHPRMATEPLIFVQVALTDGLAGDVQRLLDIAAPPGDATRADTAIFYSISNCQAGLRGIGFGNFLIKHVVRALKRELPNIRNFATLSPIPGFRSWLDRRIEADAVSLREEEREALALAHPLPGLEDESDSALLRRMLAQDGWWHSISASAALEAPLVRLAAEYLTTEKRSDGLAANPVEHFHVDNGAELHRICYLADRSAGGLRGSYGLMVNYRYPLDRVDANHEAYRSSGHIALGRAVDALLVPPPRLRQRFGSRSKSSDAGISSKSGDAAGASKSGDAAAGARAPAG